LLLVALAALALLLRLVMCAKGGPLVCVTDIEFGVTQETAERIGNG
jgi:hypothetical protein